MKKLPIPYQRIHSRITVEQKAFIEEYAQKKQITEGTVIREAMDFFIKGKKK